MRNCSVTIRLQITSAGREAYEALAHFHYREPHLGPAAAIYAIIDTHPAGTRLGKAVGVIVYTMPAAALELRNIATAGRFCGLGDRAMQMQLVNENIRCISRVIIEPRYRGLGLACRLVSETMPKLAVPIIEAMAVMGQINPFFEKAGMKAYSAPAPVRCVQLIEALSLVGIEERQFLDPQGVQKKLDRLPAAKGRFIAEQFRLFLQAYGKRRHTPPGLARTKYILSRLTARPVYYIWFNEERRQSREPRRVHGHKPNAVYGTEASDL